MEPLPGSNSMDGPPADVASNQLSFTVSLATAGPRRLFARLRAPSGKNDSFWVRINGGPWIRWWEGLQTGNGFAWREIAGGPYTLPAGQVTITLAYREEGTQFDKLLLTTEAAPVGIGPVTSDCEAPDPAPTPGPDLADYYAEAECAEVGTQWRLLGNTNASNKAFAVFPGSENRPVPTQDLASEQIRFAPEVAQAGEYALFVRMNTPSPGAASKNSFWISIDGGSWVKFWQEEDGSQLLTDGFAWKKVTEDGRPLTLALSTGVHSIRIAPREAGAQLDKIYLGPANAGTPSGAGKSASNCSGAQQNVAAGTLPSLQQLSPPVPPSLSLYPNPAGEQLTVVLTGSTASTLEAFVTDAHGRTVQRRSYSVAGQEAWQTELDVSALPAGLYHLHVIGEELPLHRTFTKQ